MVVLFDDGRFVILGSSTGNLISAKKFAGEVLAYPARKPDWAKKMLRSLLINSAGTAVYILAYASAAPNGFFFRSSLAPA